MLIHQYVQSLHRAECSSRNCKTRPSGSQGRLYDVVSFFDVKQPRMSAARHCPQYYDCWRRVPKPMWPRLRRSSAPAAHFTLRRGNIIIKAMACWPSMPSSSAHRRRQRGRRCRRAYPRKSSPLAALAAIIKTAAASHADVPRFSKLPLRKFGIIR